MKRLTMMLVLIASMCYGQEKKEDEQYQFQTGSTSIVFWSDELGEWEEWSDWKENLILIVIKQPAVGFNTMKIYSKNPQHYTVYTTEDVSDQYDDGTSAKWWKALDEDGEECTIKIINYTDATDQIIVNHSDYRVAYTIYTIDTDI